MDGKRFLNSVKFTNLLSFGPEGMELELQPLNVLIGANGCGKSNFIDAMRILQAIPIDINLPFSKGDTISEWKWKGGNLEDLFVSFNMNNSENGVPKEFLFEMIISAKKTRAYIKYEHVSKIYEDNTISEDAYEHIEDSKYSFLTGSFSRGKGIVFYTDPIMNSILSNIKEIRVYSDYELGRYSKIRMPQNASLDPGDIFEGFGNLSLVINDLISKPEILNQIIDKMKIFYENVVNVNTRVAFGTIQLYLQEIGLSETIPATRLSDGTIRFLSLLAILLHPEPPPLICLEEPELGMHPDIIHVIADLLIEASQRTQLVITTHSDILVSAIGRNYPESIVVCDKDEKGTRMKRLDPKKMQVWLEKYSMGELWLSGEIGGGRW